MSAPIPSSPPVALSRVRELLSYDPKTGEVTWRVHRGGKTGAGSRAGYTKSLGYREVRVDGKRMYSHQIAWLLTTGEWPPETIDHADGNPANNRFANLRRASRSQNNVNRCASIRSSTGLKGVFPQFAQTCRKTGKSIRTGRYRAQIKIQGKVVSLGVFDTPEAGDAAYRLASERAYGQFAYSARAQA